MACVGGWIETETEGEAKVPRHSFEEDFQMTPG